MTATKYVRKCEGDVVPFDPEKIAIAIGKAILAEDGEPNNFLARELAKEVAGLLAADEIVDVEDIQDTVEQVLMSQGYYDYAKRYILYREQRRQVRELKKTMTLDLVDSYLDKTDWRVKENANSLYSIQGLNAYIAGTVSANYWLNKLYPREIAEAHINGDIHIHDIGSGLLSYCCGWDLQELLLEGFGGVPGQVFCDPPEHLNSAIGQLISFLFSVQQDCAGAVAVSNFDTLLAPFVHADKLDYKQVKQCIQEFIYQVNMSGRTGMQRPFTNVTFDFVVPEHMRGMPAIVGGKFYGTYGDFQKEAEMITRAFFEVMYEGDAVQQSFPFPIPTINVTDDFNWESEAARALLKATARFGTPYFANFINSDMKPEDVRSFCCRLRLDLRELMRKGGGLFGASPKTGSISVCTINLARLGYLSKDRKEYFQRLRHLVDLAIRSLNIKRELVEAYTEHGLHPFARRYLESVKKSRGAYWGNHFGTVGVIGMNEACLNLLGVDIAHPDSYQLALDTLNFIRDILVKKQQEYGLMYNLEATPAEGCLAGDTLVKTVDGDIPIKDLVGKEFGVWSFDEKTGKICVKRAHAVRKTRENAQVIRLTFDNGTSLIMTPDHPVAVNSFNRWGKPSITWMEAAEIPVGRSIKSLYFSEKYNGGYILCNSCQLRSHILYEWFYNDTLQEDEVVHHIDGNKQNDTKENLVKMKASEHKRLHGYANKIHLPYLCGEDNPFYGRKHTPESIEKLCIAKRGKPFVLKNISEEEFKRICSIAAKNKRREKHSHYRHDIATETVVKMYKAGFTYAEIARAVGATTGLVQSRLRSVGLNHKLVKVEYLEERMDVYNLEVDDTHCFFVDDGKGNGILVHNCSYRLARLDKKHYPDIIVANEEAYKKGAAPYYTNSTMLPVNYTNDLFVALKHQSPLLKLYTGGSVFHVFLGEREPDPEACAALIDRVFHKFELPYMSLTPTYSICQSHGYFFGRHDSCPQCGAPCEVYSRVVGYYRPTSAYNDGKRAEFNDRATFDSAFESLQV